MFKSTFVIADDHPLSLKGLGDFLKSQGYEILKASKDGSEALKSVMDLKPDFAILDIEMPYITGIQISEIVGKSDIKTKIILISYQIESSIIRHGQKIGVKGFILKEDALGEIVDCVSTISEGEVYISKSLRDQHFDASSQPLDSLTPTELKVVKRISEGMTSREISLHYNISERTVEKHRSNIISKLQLEGAQFSLLTWVNENKSFISKL